MVDHECSRAPINGFTGTKSRGIGHDGSRIEYRLVVCALSNAAAGQYYFRRFRSVAIMALIQLLPCQV